jgi:hypothetical protein
LHSRGRKVADQPSRRIPRRKTAARFEALHRRRGHAGDQAHAHWTRLQRGVLRGRGQGDRAVMRGASRRFEFEFEVIVGYRGRYHGGAECHPTVRVRVGLVSCFKAWIHSRSLWLGIRKRNDVRSIRPGMCIPHFSVHMICMLWTFHPIRHQQAKRTNQPRVELPPSSIPERMNAMNTAPPLRLHPRGYPQYASRPRMNTRRTCSPRTTPRARLGSSMSSSPLPFPSDVS